MTQLDAEFFKRDPITCARELIGCIFAWDGCTARIVETEAYTAIGDEASHAFVRPSTRAYISTHAPGDTYVYLNYGVHWLFNILVKGGKMDGFVLFRALEPLSGLEKMRARRPGVEDLQLCSGPGKLTKALAITGAHHGGTILNIPDRYIMDGPSPQLLIGPRIGITKAKDFPWRFGARDSLSLSRKF